MSTAVCRRNRTQRTGSCERLSTLFIHHVWWWCFFVVFTFTIELITKHTAASSFESAESPRETMSASVTRTCSVSTPPPLQHALGVCIAWSLHLPSRIAHRLPQLRRTADTTMGSRRYSRPGLPCSYHSEDNDHEMHMLLNSLDTSAHPTLAVPLHSPTTHAYCHEY